jgi:hypothetical protein
VRADTSIALSSHLHDTPCHAATTDTTLRGGVLQKLRIVVTIRRRNRINPVDRRTARDTIGVAKQENRSK